MINLTNDNFLKSRVDSNQSQKLNSDTLGPSDWVITVWSFSQVNLIFK